MMAKIVKGSDFKGAVDYIIDKKKDTQIVASEGLFMENLETIAMSFNAQSRMNDKVTKPVGHIALSFSKEDELRLTNRIMAGIALEYMAMKNCVFLNIWNGWESRIRSSSSPSISTRSIHTCILLSTA